MALTQQHYELLGSTAQAFKLEALDALAGTPLGAPPTAIIALFDQPDDCCDQLSIILHRLTPIDITGRQLGAGYPLGCEPWRWAAGWEVRVSRSCAPTVGPGGQPPAPVDEESNALLVFQDSVALACQFAYRAHVVATARLRELKGMTIACAPYTPGAITPHNGGGCSGWSYQFTTAIDCG